MSDRRRSLPRNTVDWGIAARPLAGETVSGDREVATAHATGALLAAIDGLGHGVEAAHAAKAAAEVLQAEAGRAPEDLIEACHQALRRTRGAAISLASFDAARGIVSWLGVGNVEAVLFRDAPAAGQERESLLLRSGVVGYRLPTLRASALSVAAGDLMILATDGIAAAFAHRRPAAGRPADIAAEILRRHGKTTDDALVLVARCLEVGP
jgi:serine phosphatase RsbU (regulator of sigma subunit)